MSNVSFSREWKVLGAVLNLYNDLELHMSDLIVSYVRPTNLEGQAFMMSHVLHNSSISFAGKARLILAIAKEVKGPKFSRDDFHRIMNIRNALAHGISSRSVRVPLNTLLTGIHGEHLVVQTLRGDGSVEQRRTTVAVSECVLIAEKLELKLKELEAKILA